MSSGRVIFSLLSAALLSSGGLQGQAVPAYQVGSIPPLLAYQGQQVQITVQPPVKGMPISVRFAPVPKGATTTDAASGLFSYQAAPEDRFEFVATFTAGGGTSSAVSQDVVITPIATLRPEQDVIQYLRPIPDETSGSYITKTERDGTNLAAMNCKGPTASRIVEISGRTVILDPSSDQASLYAQLNWGGPGNPAVNCNIEQLTIYAETLVVRGELRLPQTTVVIYARELAFQDYDSSPGLAKFNTSPAPFAVAAAADAGSTTPPSSKGGDGLPGPKAGDITLHVGRVSAQPQNRTISGFNGPVQVPYTRFVMTGGGGQNPGKGIDGLPGNDFRYATSIPAGLMQFESGHDFFGNKFYYDCRWAAQTPPYGVVSLEVDCSTWPVSNPYGSSPWAEQYHAWPGDGNPATPPGKPGVGGDGGTIRSSVAVAGYVTQSGGPSGTPAPTAIGGRGGLPSPAYWWDVMSSKAVNTHTSKTYPNLPGPSADRPAGTAGQTLTLAEVETSWIHVYSLRATLNWVKDAYIGGNLAAVRTTLQDYPANIQKLIAAGSPSSTQLVQSTMEIEGLLQRLDANLDFYGNPAGWIPLLSLEANMQLLSGEITAAVPILYLADRVQGLAKDQVKRADALKSLISSVGAEIQAAKKQYSDTEVTIQQIQDESRVLQKDVLDTQTAIQNVEAQLLQRAQQNVTDRNYVPQWKQACRVLSVACTVIPVYQPALGFVGQGLNLLSNVDTNQPLDTLKQGYELGKNFNDDTFTKSQSNLNDLLNKLNLNAVNASDPSSISAFATNAKDVYNSLAPAIDKIRQALQTNGAPQSEVDAELKAVEASDPVFQDLVAKITDLNARKTANAQSLTKALDTLTRAIDTINTDLTAVAQFQSSLNSTLSQMDQPTTIYVKEMDRRQRDRLQTYLYYMAKAYEYRLLRPYPGDLTLGSLVVKLQDFLRADKSSLSAADIQTVLAPYVDQLRQVILDGVHELQVKPPERNIDLKFGLTDAELNTLNATGQVQINLSTKLPSLPTDMNRRIASLSVIGPPQLGVDTGGAKLTTGSLRIVIEHFGQSTITSDDPGAQGFLKTYLFRFGSPGFEKPFSWGASYDLVDSTFSPETLSLSGYSALQTFLQQPGSNPPSANDLKTLPTYVEPSFDSWITVRKYVNPQLAAATIKNLRFTVGIDFYRGDSKRVTLDVLAPSTGSPLVSVDQPDLTSRTDGKGTFRRWYNSGQRVTLKTDPLNSTKPFQQWVDGQGTVLGNSPTLVVTLGQSNIVQPVYAGGQVTPAGSPCNCSLSASGQTMAASGGSGTVSVVGIGPWTVGAAVSWIQITSGSSGSGNGTVTFTVAANTGAPRSGLITVGNQTYAIHQGGTASDATPGCTYSFQPAIQEVAAAGGTGSVQVSALSACSWRATANDAWVNLKSGTSTTNGSGTVTFTADANTSGIPRSTAIVIAGQVVAINQGGGVSPSSTNGTVLAINQVDMTGCPATRLTATVTAPQGSPVTGLSASSFALTEDGLGRSVTVRPLGGDASALTIALLIDNSGSVDGQPLNDEKAAAKTLLGQLAATDLASVISFSDSVVVKQDFTTNRTLLNQAVDSIAVQKNTSLYDAIDKAATLLSGQTGRRAIVVMTDGEDTSSSRSVNEAIASAVQAGVPVFAVGFGQASGGILTQVSSQTGGYYSPSASSGDLGRILPSVGQVLENQYSIDYTSVDGTRSHSVSLSVTNGGQTAIATRSLGACATLPTVTLAGGNIAGRAGSSVDVPISLTSTSASPASFQLDASFDGQKLKLNSVRKGDSVTSAGKDLNSQTLSATSQRLVCTGLNQNVIANGTVAILNFTLNSGFTSGDAQVTLSNCLATDARSGSISTNCSVGKVSVQGSCGCDVNGDGTVNIADVQLIINQVLGSASAICDVNGDGAVNIADVQRVINAVLGLGCN